MRSKIPERVAIHHNSSELLPIVAPVVSDFGNGTVSQNARSTRKPRASRNKRYRTLKSTPLNPFDFWPNDNIISEVDSVL